MFSHDELSQEVTPYISVVVPCFNSRRTVGDCLRSLETQHYPRDRYEIIVADNGSGDGSAVFIREHFPSVVLVEAAEKGSGYARNAGCTVAKGDLILSTDADCVPAPNWIFAMVQFFLKAPMRTAAVGGFIAPFYRRTFVERFFWTWVSQPHEREPDPWIRYSATPNAGFRASALSAVGGFDGTLGFDDTDLGIRLEAAGYTIAFTNTAVVRHRNPVTLAELYRHRFKYGRFGFSIAQKHPTLLGNPRGPWKRMHLLFETVWRTLKDAIKLPATLVFFTGRRPCGWPLIDAVMAWGNYMGFRSASLAADVRLA